MAGQAESLDGTQGLGDQAARDNGALRGGLQHPLSLSSHAGLEGVKTETEGEQGQARSSQGASTVWDQEKGGAGREEKSSGPWAVLA